MTFLAPHCPPEDGGPHSPALPVPLPAPVSGVTGQPLGRTGGVAFPGAPLRVFLRRERAAVVIVSDHRSPSPAASRPISPAESHPEGVRVRKE